MTKPRGPRRPAAAGLDFNVINRSQFAAVWHSLDTDFVSGAERHATNRVPC